MKGSIRYANGNIGTMVSVCFHNILLFWYRATGSNWSYIFNVVLKSFNLSCCIFVLLYSTGYIYVPTLHLVLTFQLNSKLLNGYNERWNCLIFWKIFILVEISTSFHELYWVVGKEFLQDVSFLSFFKGSGLLFF